MCQVNAILTNSQLSDYFVFCCKLMMTGFKCQMPAIIPYRGTLSPPAFKPLLSQKKRKFLWDTEALCAATWLNVAECVQKPCLRHAFLYGISWLWHLKPSVIHKYILPNIAMPYLMLHYKNCYTYNKPCLWAYYPEGTEKYIYVLCLSG